MEKLLNMVFLGLSNWIFGAVSGIYSLFYGLATTRLFRADTIKNVSDRVYILVSVVILFAFSVKLIEAIVNPDLLTDAKKGVTGVLKRTIIGLLLIVAIPNIFNFVYYLQAEIIVGSVVEKLILGYTDTDSSSGVEGAGGVLTSAIISSFITPIDINGVTITDSSLCGDDENCNFAQELINKNADYEPYVTFLGGEPQYSNLNKINIDKVWEKGKPIYDINGLALVVVGCFVLYQIIVMCMDAGLRLVELGLLEMIAPVVIVSYIASGADHLSKWAKMTVQKFTSILIRIAGLCFMVLGFQLMNDRNSIFNNDSVSFWFKVFLIIGLLRMVKELPDILGNLFGAKIKMGGIKDKLGEMAGIGKMAQNAWSGIGKGAKGLAATVGAGAAAGIGKGAKALDKKVLGGKGADLVKRVGESGVVRGAKVLGAGVKSGGKGTAKALKESYEKNFAQQVEEGKMAEKEEAKKKVAGKISTASGNKLVRKDGGKGKIDFDASMLKMDANGKITGLNSNFKNGASDVKNLNSNIVKGMGGVSDTARKLLNDHNENMFKVNDAQRKSDLQNDVLNQLSSMGKLTKNSAQASAIENLSKGISSGAISDVNQINREMENIAKLGEGQNNAISKESMDQYKGIVNATATRAQEGGVLGTSQAVLESNLSDAKSDLDKSTKDVNGLKEKMSGTSLETFDGIISAMEKGYETISGGQRALDAENINKAIADAVNARSSGSTAATAAAAAAAATATATATSVTPSPASEPAPSRPGGSTVASEVTPGMAGTSTEATVSSEPAPAGRPGGSTVYTEVAPGMAGTQTQTVITETPSTTTPSAEPTSSSAQHVDFSSSTTGGSVNANVDMSGLENKLDSINNTIKTSSGDVTNAVNNASGSINESLRTTNETLSNINRGIQDTNLKQKETNKKISSLGDSLNDKDDE